MQDKIKKVLIIMEILGIDFDLAAINAVFEQKSRQLAQNGEQSISSRPSILDRLQTAKASKINTYHDSISRMVDVTPDKGVGFEHWAKIFNPKPMVEIAKVGEISKSNAIK